MRLLRGCLAGAIVLGASQLFIPTPARTAPPAEAREFRPKEGATFNLPRRGDEQYRIHSVLVDAIDNAPRDSIIRISVFSFDRKFVASKLVRAHRRGVIVQVLLNDHQVSPAQRILHRGLGTNRNRRSFAYECTNGCRSTGENNHSKFFLFSTSGVAKDVVMVGSTNITMNSAKNQFNDLWVRNDAPDLYSAFVSVFRKMRKDRAPRSSPYLRYEVGSSYVLRATPFPNFSARNDPMISALNKVDCVTAGRRTAIRVVMHVWSDDRGAYLARKVRSLYDNGCDVRLIHGYVGTPVRDQLDNRTSRGFLSVHTTAFDTDDDDLIDLYSHQKELLIGGHYGNDRSVRYVFTGSSNWQDGGLRGDEVIFSVKKNAAYEEYVRNFDYIWTERSVPVNYIPLAGRLGARNTLGDGPRLGGPAWEDD
jgi:phosphatidylserine/phosphatidylglycerophosphate/cardiolipin synthase-like enzyme